MIEGTNDRGVKRLILSNEIPLNHPGISCVFSRRVCFIQLCAGISMGIAGGGDGKVHDCGRGEVGQLGL
jgi:hypothetical protein